MNNIQSMRKRFNITIEELAGAIESSKSTISHYETGRRKPNLDVCREIVLFFNRKGIPATLDSVFPPKAA